MPELPDLTIYLEALEHRIRGRSLERIVLKSPFLLRTVLPPIGEAVGRTVVGLRRLGKRVLESWTDRLRKEAGDGLPEGVTAFREGMAVHGRFGRPCPVCGSKVQRRLAQGTER